MFCSWVLTTALSRHPDGKHHTGIHGGGTHASDGAISESWDPETVLEFPWYGYTPASCFDDWGNSRTGILVGPHRHWNGKTACYPKSDSLKSFEGNAHETHPDLLYKGRTRMESGTRTRDLLLESPKNDAPLEGPAYKEKTCTTHEILDY